MHASALLFAAALSVPLSYASPLAIGDMSLDFVKDMLNKREDGLTNPLMDQVPTCKGADHDPTWTKGKSMYEDDTGVFIGKDCAHKGDKNDCWTDYMIVGSKFAYAPWTQAMGNINCPDNGTCSQAVGKWGQSCKSFEWSVTETIGLEFDLEIFKAKTEISSMQGQTRTNCNTDTTTSTCTWNNEGCHSIWKSDMTQTVFGYMRRSCTKPSHSDKANMKDSAVRKDGCYTRGMTDFQFDLPGVTAIDCDGTCDAGYAGPAGLPHAEANGDMVPWPAS
jgi:hypothetical protein